MSIDVDGEDSTPACCSDDEGRRNMDVTKGKRPLNEQEGSDKADDEDADADGLWCLICQNTYTVEEKGHFCRSPCCSFITQ